jgi:hypothetical protein
MYYQGSRKSGQVTVHLKREENPIALSNGCKSRIIKKLPLTKGVLTGTFHVFMDASPALVKEYLKKNGGSSKYKRIITMAGNMAARCQSFGAADFGDCLANGTLAWHHTEMYLSASKSMDQPELLQTAGRLCVVAKDHIPLTFYGSKSTCNDLIKAYWLQEEMIARARDQQGRKYLKRILSDLAIHRNKLCSRSLTKKAEYTVNTVSKAEDKAAGGWSKKRTYISVDEEGNKRQRLELVVEKEEKKDEVDEENGDVEDGDVPPHPNQEEFKRLTLRMFPKWSKSHSNIGTFMDRLNPNKIYKRAELDDICPGRVTDYIVIPGAKRVKNGDILEKIGNDAYRLYPSLVLKFNEYFSG